MEDVVQTRAQLDEAGVSTPFERFKHLFRLILSHQSTDDLFELMLHCAQRHGAAGAAASAFDKTAFARLVQHLMPDEFTELEVSSGLA